MFSPSAAFSAALCLGGSCAVAATVSSPADQWTAVVYVNPSSSDPSMDQQTGVRDGDIVGNATHASFYTTFNNNGTPGNLTDGQIGFRLRVAGDQNPSGFASAFWVGIDLNFDGDLDVFAGAIEGSTVGLYRAGSDLNISPSTTSIDSHNPFFTQVSDSLNYQFAPITAILDPTATSFNLDNGSGGGGDHTDHFVSFMLPFNELANAATALGISGFDENDGLRYVTATSNQSNSLNQDLNGLPKTYDGALTWNQLGAFTPVYSSAGFVVPEPGVFALAATGLLVACGGSRRRRL